MWTLQVDDLIIHIKLFKGKTSSVDYMLFNQDIDNDGSIGVDLSNLELITTDTSSTNVKLKRGSGSL